MPKIEKLGVIIVAKYKEISIWGFQHGSEDPKTEYIRRFNSPATIHTGLKINPILRGERLPQEYELFLMTIPELMSLESAINQNSKRISQISDDLPRIAADQLFNNTLVHEIVSTNEIEDVKTTSQEVTDAISKIDSKKVTRLQSFAKMYFRIKDRKNLSIKEPKDIRKIYDFLLKGEIEEKKLPDGQMFRDSFARIGNDVKTVHMPKPHESDFLPDIINWINFVNSDVPFLIKAFIAHYYFEYIHPFNDGNGRTGRYIVCVYLGYKLDPLTAITFSSEINQNRKRYYDAFVDVENPKNFGEITFFVISMMKILIKGQKKLLSDLEKKKDVLRFGENKIYRQYKELKARCLNLYYQAFLFNDSGFGIEDRDIKQHYLKEYPWTQIRRCLDGLTDDGLLEKTKKSPITRKVTEKFVNSLID